MPIPGAMAGQGTRVAMAEWGAWVAMVDPGTQESMAERGAWVAMVDSGTQEAMAERGAWVAMMDRGAWVASMAGSPPPKFSWGNSSSQGGAQEVRTPGGTLEAWSLGTLGSRTEPAGAPESWTERSG